MREIKFRAWCSGRHENMTFNESYMDYEVTIKNGMYADVVSGWDIHGTYETVPLMQYTGLKDKNGKEIYEGDVVLFKKKNHEIRYFDNYGMFAMVGANLYSSNVIDESKPMGSRGSSTNYKPYVLNEYYQKRIEVIGNIYENSELLSNE